MGIYGKVIPIVDKLALKAVPSDFIFASELARDTFFTTNPDRLKNTINVVIDLATAVLQQYIGDASLPYDNTKWQDITSTIKGEKGDKGDSGSSGVGVPVGGLTGQSLIKASDSDNDTTWGYLAQGINNNNILMALGGDISDTGKQFNDLGITVSDVWSASKILSEIQSQLGKTLTIKGNWDADTNTPNLDSILEGETYIVSVAGTNYGYTFGVNDWIVKTDSGYAKVDNQTATVVFSQIGGNPLDNGALTIEFNKYIKKLSTFTVGNLPILSSTGEIEDSGKNLSDLFTKSLGDYTEKAVDLAPDDKILVYDQASTTWKYARIDKISSTGGGDGKVLVSATDSLSEFLENKINGTANYITITKSDVAGVEFLKIDISTQSKDKIDTIVTSGDGLNFLANDGTYKSITSAEWGNITGTLSNQTDLQNELNDKFSKTSDTLDDITDGTTYVKTTNDYTDLEKAKLTGIEAGAEVNQSDLEIKTQYEANDNTNAFTDDEKSKLANIQNPLLFKGGITLNSDFPTSIEVQNGWTYTILANVTDNDISKTNTGQSFLAEDEISWNGVDWTQLGSSSLWLDDGTDIKTIESTRNIDLQNNTIKNINTLQLDTSIVNPSYKKGEIFYDNSKNAVSYYNEINDIVVNLGHEILFQVENQTGSDITNGSVLYPDSTTIVALANSKNKNKSRIIGVATHDIPNGSIGYITKVGQVGGLNTSGFQVGDILYLSDVVDGTFTNQMPSKSSFVVTVGVVDVVDAVDGIITVDTRSNDTTIEVFDTNGFPEDQRLGTNLSYIDLTRTFTISPTGSEFHFYELGEKFEQVGSDSVVWTDEEGEHFFYYEGGVLSHIYDPSIAERTDIVQNKCFVAYIYWNSVDKKVEYDVFDERHGISMSPKTHVYLHLTRGAQYVSGMAIENIISDGNGSLNTHAQYGITQGVFFDEDLTHITESKTVGDTIPVAYLQGVNGDLRVSEQTGFGVLNAPAGRLYFNEWTGTEWQLTETSNADFVLYHLFAVNGNSKQIVSIVGNSEYTNIGNARAGANQEISDILLRFDINEIIPIATMIYQTRDTYTNDVKARVVQTDTGEDFVSWIGTELAQGASPSSHANLTNLELADDGVTWGHINNQAQNIFGVKAFDSFPITPSSSPTLDYQVANKKYVDDKYPITSEIVGVETKVVAGFDYTSSNSCKYIISYNDGVNYGNFEMLVLTNGTIINSNEFGTNDIGDVSSIVFTNVINGNNVELRATNTTGSYTVKINQLII